MQFSGAFVSDLNCALSVQAHLRHRYQHLLIDELRLSLSLYLLTLCYQLVEVEEESGEKSIGIASQLALLANCHGSSGQYVKSHISTAFYSLEHFKS